MNFYYFNFDKVLRELPLNKDWKEEIENDRQPYFKIYFK
jgi:hypothetical protein